MSNQDDDQYNSVSTLLRDREGSAGNGEHSPLDPDTSAQDYLSDEGAGLYSSSQGSSDQPRQRTVKMSFSPRKAGASLGVILAVFGGGSFLATTAPLLSGVHFVQGVSKDLADRATAATIGNNRIMMRKMTSSIGGMKTAFCQKASILCRTKSFSKTELARLERAGIKVNPAKDKAGILKGRTVPESIDFRGRKYTPAQWKAATKLGGPHTAEQLAQLKANNMRYRGLSSKGPFKFVAARFGLTKKPPGLKGSRQDRINQLMTAANTSNPKAMKLIDVVDDDGNPVKNNKGESIKALTTEDSGLSRVTDAEATQKGLNKYSGDSQIKKAQGIIDQAAKQKTLSPKMVNAKAKALGAASLLGGLDLACSIKNGVTAASVAAKIASEYNIIRFGDKVLPTIGAAMAGEATIEQIETMFEFLNETDSRKTIDEVDSEGKPIKLPNPDYGKNAMSHFLLGLSTQTYDIATNGVPGSIHKYSFGISPDLLLKSGAGAAVSMTQMLDRFGGRTGCSVIQHPLTRGIGIGAAIFAGAGSGGSSLIWQGLIAASMIGAMATLDYVIQSALTGDISSELADSKVDRGGALWGSIAATESSTARAMGMKPVTSDEEMMLYQNLVNDVDSSYIALEKSEGKENPFDITNQFSFAGSIAKSLTSNFGYSLNASTFMPGIVSSIVKPISSSAKVGANASQYDPARFEVCKDEEYLNLGLKPDVLCNIRFAMSKEELNLDEDVVIEYMANNNYVPIDSETGLPDGYEPPDPAHQQTLLDMVKGTAYEMTIGQFFAPKIYTNDYAKYLDACVYRIAPYGNTGEETQRFFGLEREWNDGIKCFEESEQMSMFRKYTLIVSNLRVTDEEEHEPDTPLTSIFGRFFSPSGGEGGYDTGVSGSSEWTVNKNHNGLIDKSGSEWDRWVAALGGNGNNKNGVLKPVDLPGDNICSQSISINGAGGGNLLNPNAAASLKAMVTAFNAANSGRYLIPGACFRSYAGQVLAKKKFGSFAATPGKSNHGWGLAIDFRVSTTPGGLGASINSFSSSDYRWMSDNGYIYGWINPVNMRPGGTGPIEPWHFQYVGPLFGSSGGGSGGGGGGGW